MKTKLKINQNNKCLNIEGLDMQLKIRNEVNLDNFVQFFLDVFAELIVTRYKLESKKIKTLGILKDIKNKLSLN